MYCPCHRTSMFISTGCGRKDKVREETSTGAALHLRHHGYERGSSESITAASCESRELWDPARISRHMVKPIRNWHYFWLTNQTPTLSLSSALPVRYWQPHVLLEQSSPWLCAPWQSVHLILIDISTTDILRKLYWATTFMNEICASMSSLTISDMALSHPYTLYPQAIVEQWRIYSRKLTLFFLHG